MVINNFSFKRIKNWSDSKVLDNDFTPDVVYLCQNGSILTNNGKLTDQDLGTFGKWLGVYEILSVTINGTTFYK